MEEATYRKGGGGGLASLQEELRKSKNRDTFGQTNNAHYFEHANKAKYQQHLTKHQHHQQQLHSIIQEEGSSQLEDSSQLIYNSQRSQSQMFQGGNMMIKGGGGTPSMISGKDSVHTVAVDQQRTASAQHLGIKSSIASKGGGQLLQPPPHGNFFGRQSTFTSDGGLSAIKPLKSTTSAQHLHGGGGGSAAKHSTYSRRGGGGGGHDGETSKTDFLYTEDFGSEGGFTSYRDGGAGVRGEEDMDVDDDSDSEDNGDYDDESGDSAAYDDSRSNLSNPFQDYQDGDAGQLLQQKAFSSQHYVLFIDPESFLYYRKDLLRNDYVVFEPFVDEQLKNEFFKANQIHLYKIRKLLVLENFSWNFKGEADLYRRRHFPTKFLQNEASDYPCYVFQSELSKAFNHKGDIETVVDLIEYKYTLAGVDANEVSIGGSERFDIRFKESLVTSTKEFIKNILRKVYEKYKVKIKPRSNNHNLILKADGYREYFEGNYQLLQYERVRACLRKNEPMKLILTEIPKNYRDRRFPPIFRIKQEVPPVDQLYNLPLSGGINQSQQHMSTAHGGGGAQEGDHSGTMMGGGVQGFRFESLKGSSPYFWYPPVPNLKQLYDRMEKSAKQKTSSVAAAVSTTSGGNTGFGQGGIDRNFLRKVVYVAPDKELVSLTEHRHKMGGTTIPRQNQEIILHSGECNWRFKFKLVGIERLDVIFNEIRQRVATDNKNTEPRNVTLKPTKVATKRLKREVASNIIASGSTVNDLYDDDDNGSPKNIDNTLAGAASQSVVPMNDAANQSIAAAVHHHGSRTGSQSQLNLQSKSKSIFGGLFTKKSKQLNEEAKKKQHAMQQQLSQQQQQQEEETFLSVDIPSILKQTMKLYTPSPLQAKSEASKEEEKLKKKKKKKSKHGHGEIIHLKEDEEKYIEKELKYLHTPFCNFSSSFGTIVHYQNILSILFGKMTPLKIQVECTLYHGCEVLTAGVLSEEVYFGNTPRFEQWITFGNLRYCQIPMKTRLSFNINMLTKEGQTLTIACVSMNLFDEKGRFRSGMRDLNVWPFYELDERLGCMKEYNGMTVEQATAKDFHRTIDSLFTKLVVEFESFICPLYYSSRDEKKIEFFHLSTNREDKQDKFNLINVQIRNQDLAQLKKYLNCNPLSKIDDNVKRDLFKCREHYQTHPQGLPIFLRSVQWNRPIQVNEVYKMLTNWAPMKPEEAISLLDAKFPDERVRQYAVQRISQLSDDDLALYMLQFAQALLYEEQHYSPLSEMLIERSLRNPYVVGHAFYWSLKSNLYLKVSYERYYVLLEQFLMLCGNFKEEIWIQQKVNTGLKHVSEGVVHNRYKEKIPFGEVKEKARHELRNQRKKLPFLFTMTIDPKIVIKDFNYDKLTVFSSKKVPLCITSLNQQPGGKKLVCLFKNGDDLRQDILTLQIIYIMDKIWLANNLDLAMTPYKVLGTDCEQGYLEFVANCKTLAMIQYDRSVFHTFSDDTIEKFMESYLKQHYPQDWEMRLKRNRQVFIRSTAGYCVASYILGLGDRHPDNIMINYEEGNFLHIDFGHFLGNVKKKFGIKRERDPFVFSKEVAYFVNGGPLTRQQAKVKINRKISEDEHRLMSESMLTDDYPPGPTTQQHNGGSPGGIDESILTIGGGMANNPQDDSEMLDESLKSKTFRDFEEKCCQAYNILRKEGHQLINMFLIMLSAGMPELKRDDDIQFMVNRLDLGISEQEASNKFKKEIQRAMQTYSRRFDNFIHNLKAKYGK